MTNECEHNYGYAGMRYRDGSRSLPGSGATRRYYAHIYFCSKCACTLGRLAPVERNSYSKIEFNATPGTAEECHVPEHDR